VTVYRCVAESATSDTSPEPSTIDEKRTAATSESAVGTIITETKHGRARTQAALAANTAAANAVARHQRAIQVDTNCIIAFLS